MPKPPCKHLATAHPKPACALCILCALCGLAPQPSRAEQPARPNVGEAYLLRQPAAARASSAPGQALQQSLQSRTLSQAALLDTSSRLWAGAQGLLFTHERAAVLLATNVIAESGDADTAAASHADGRIELFGAVNCTSVAMPEGHPAYALALAKQGTILAAWAQGLNQLVFFDLTKAGCPASAVEVALRGQLKLTLSASGTFLAAQDETGRLWVGPRNGQMHDVMDMKGAPAALGFSDGEGVLLAIDSLGRGGAWNPRTGVLLHPLKVPGGPFARGEFRANEARLWTPDGRVVRWNVLQNSPAQAEISPAEATTGKNEGWLELRGAELYYARPGLSWRPNPVYEIHPPQLALSRHARCLRLSDMDGMVRYYDARTGLPHAQCFAEDWTPVPVQPDGTAQIPGLALRIFDQAHNASGKTTVNIRAISEDQVLLWTEAAPNLSLHVEAPVMDQTVTSAKAHASAKGDVATMGAHGSKGPAAHAGGQGEPQEMPTPTPAPFTVQLRQGISAEGPARALLLQ